MVTKIVILLGISVASLLCWAAEPEIVEFEEMTVVGMQSLVSMKHNIIHELWTRFMESGQEIENPAIEGVYFGISWGYKHIGEDEKKEMQFFHLVGAPVTSFEILPEGFTYKRIPAQQYAKFVHRGPLTDLTKTYDHIFIEWLPGSEYLYDEEKFDIEWYDERFKYGEEDSELDIYVPVMKKTE